MLLISILVIFEVSEFGQSVKSVRYRRTLLTVADGTLDNLSLFKGQ